MFYTRNCNELPESSQRALSLQANYSSLEIIFNMFCLWYTINIQFKILLFLTPIHHRHHRLHYFHQQVSFFVSKLVLSCMLEFLQVMKTFCDSLYWQVQQGMQPLHLHCWAIWCFLVCIFLSAVLVIVSISPFMKSPRCKNNWSGVFCHCCCGVKWQY